MKYIEHISGKEKFVVICDANFGPYFYECDNLEDAIETFYKKVIDNTCAWGGDVHMNGKALSKNELEKLGFYKYGYAR